MIVLWWIRGRSRRCTPFGQWQYVPTHDNSADFVTRGMRIPDMAKEEKWWNGPYSLGMEESDWPLNQIDTDLVSEEKEIKKTAQECSQARQSGLDDDCSQIK